MNVDLDKLRNAINDEVSRDNKSLENSGSNYKLLYPTDGRLTMRLLYNIKAGTVQRRIVRHDTGKGKIACLQQYGEDCPVCSMINEAENTKGKECGAFREHGFKTRGICYAQVVDAPEKVLKDNKIEIGEIVLFMYPKKVYDTINSIMLESKDHLGELVAQNESIPIIVTRETNGGGFPDYRVEPYAYGKSKAFQDKDGKTGDQIYDEACEALPNLYEDIIPQYPNEDLRTKAKALADTIKAKFINGNVINPNEPDDDDDNPYPTPEKAVESEPIAETTKATVEPVSTSNKPECFGKYCNDKKCWACLSETDCINASK